MYRRAHIFAFSTMLFLVCFLFSNSVLFSRELPANTEHVSFSTKYDFATLMGFGKGSINPDVKKLSRQDIKDFHQFQNAYKVKSRLLPLNKGEKTRIPKVIHLIWIGPKDFPKESIPNIQSWKKHHPEWTMKFWTDRADRPLPVKGMQRVLVDEYDFGDMGQFIPKTHNYGEKADLMRFAIIYQEGGLYTDHDAECFSSFDSLHETYDFIACFERPHWHEYIKSSALPAVGLFSAAPRHKALRATMDLVIKNWDTIGRMFPGNTVKEVQRRVLRRTFDSFAKATKPFALNLKTRDIILPTCFFYPDRTLSGHFTKKLRKEGLVYSSHKYASTWKVEQKGPKEGKKK